MILFKNFSLLFTAILYTALGVAQLTLDQSITPEQAAQQLVGNGVSIENVNVTAADSSWAYYYNFNTELNATEGLLLTTGKASNAIVVNGENGTGLPIIVNQTECLNCAEFDNGFQGSDLLNTVNDRTTFDATAFEFDILVQGDSLTFDFTFASEEYEEWVGSSFNDVFGFFITGPGGFNDVNIALVPGTSEPVAINSVNNIFNAEYYYDNRNPLGQNIQYDGFTLGLQAEVGNLIPCETYTIKLIIADGTDRLYDSAVFVEKISSNAIGLETSTVGGLPYMIEGCNDGTITFLAEEISTDPQEVIYSFGGSAELVPDYTTSSPLGNNIPGDLQTITIPPGSTSTSIDIFPLDDGIIEGEEFITFYINNNVCGADVQDSIQFFIRDSLALSIIPEESEICSGNEVTLQGISDISENFIFSWEPSDLVDSPNSLVTTANPEADTEFTLTSMLASCVAEASAIVTVKTIEIDGEVTPINCAGTSTGAITITVTNATEPYTVEWLDSDDQVISNSETVAGLAGGFYMVTVIDADGCEETITFGVFEENTLETNLMLSDYNGSTISCNGICDGTASVTPSGGIAPYAIEWSENVPEGTTELTDLCPGTYSVTITDDADCVVEETFTITEPDVLAGAVLSVSEILCNGTSTGVASVTATGGTTPYFYSWSDDPSGTPILGQGPTLTDLGDGLYFVTVTDINGCEADNFVTVTVAPPPPAIEISISALTYGNGFNTSCFDSENGQVIASVSGGVPGYTLDWTDEDGNAVGSGIVIPGLGCGEYTLTATDQNGCVETETIEIICPPQISADIDVTPNPCSDFSAEAGAIDLTPLGGSGSGYTFSWQDQDGVDFGNTEDLTDLASGTYSVTITDDDGCFRTIDIQVTNEADVDVTVDTFSNNSCFETCDGVIEISVDSDAGAYTVEWSTLDGPFSMEEDLTDLCADTYFLVITAEDDCQATEEFTITQPSEIIIDVEDVVNPLCSGQNSGSIDISVSGGDGPLNVEWAPFGLFLGSTDQDIQQLTEGTYTVTVTDQSNMCVATQDVTLTAPQAIDLDIQLSSYDGGFFVSCFDESDGQLTAAASGGNPDFENLEFGYFYDWSNLPLGNDPSLPNQVNLPGSVTYGLVVTDTAGCQVEIIIPTIEPLELIPDETITNISCFGAADGSIITNISGGSGIYETIEWTGFIGVNPSDATTLTDLEAGTYTLEVFDSNGCTFEEEFTITEPDPITVEVTDVILEDCSGSGTASLTVEANGGTPGYDYDWVDQDDNTYTGSSLTDINSGDYIVTVTDLNGCLGIDTVEVNSDEAFALDLETFQIGTGAYTLACLGDENGSAQAVVSGGVPDYNYEWLDEDDTVIGSDAVVSDLAAGTYYINVNDISGCTLNDSILVTEPLTEFEAEATLINEITCFGECTGAIEVSSSGGDPEYNYLWELNGNELEYGNSADSLCIGNYEILAVDGNGCDSLIIISIDQPEEIIVDVTTSTFNGGFNISCFGENDGEINVSISGGLPDYTLNWTGNIGINDSDSDELTALESGAYSLSVIDDLDCEVTTLVTLLEPDLLSIDGIVSEITCFNDDDGIIDANPAGGSGNYNFEWDHTPDDQQIVSDLSPDTYNVIVSDENGCEATEEFLMTEPALLTVSASTLASTCGQANGSIDATPSGGTVPYASFDWDNGADDIEDPQDLEGGIYNLILTDDNGCVSTLPVLVGESDGIVLDPAIITDVSCFGFTDGCIELPINSANGTVSINWVDSEGEITNACEVSAGSYSATLIDEEGCELTETFIINSPDQIVLDLELSLYSNTFNVSEFEATDGSVNTTITGGIPDYNVSWAGPNSFSSNSDDIDDLMAGEYIIVVTDANGCEVDSVLILTSPRDLTIPSGFTPNGDGFNDAYIVLGLEQYEEVTIEVFNRWGNIVYSADNYTNNWIGENNNGDELSDGTYYVIVKGTKDGEETELNSFVDLRR
ncbi:MAG: choice-of-anchor L domain-containing protein [Flavobacteriales bacterium]